MVITVIGPNLRDQSNGSFHVHKRGCRDIDRYIESKLDFDLDSVQELVEIMYSDIMDDGEDWWSFIFEFHFLPCVDDLQLESDSDG